MAGLTLDGDNDSNAGGDYVRDFSVGGLLGDFNSDDLVNALDIDLLFLEVNAMTHDLSYDLTGDNLVTIADVDKLVRDIIGTEYGDANLDKKVNSSDAAILGGAFGTQIGAIWSMGDFSGDGKVNSSDAAILGGTFGFDNSGGGGGNAPMRVAARSPSVASAAAAARSLARGRLIGESRFESAVDRLLADEDSWFEEL